MKCEICERETTHRKVRQPHWLNGKLYVVENVDAEVCAGCGETYFHASTLDRIDRIIAGEHAVKKVLSVEVVSA